MMASQRTDSKTLEKTLAEPLIHAPRVRPLMLSGQINIGAIRKGMKRRGADNNCEAQGTENQRCAGKMAEGPISMPIGEIAGGSRTSGMMRGAGEQTTR
jgi:hypothetical protein